MWARDFWRSPRWHSANMEFRILDGPAVITVTASSVTVRWTMSEVCTGQIEYGLTSALGSTTTEQAITGGYSTHSQAVSGLPSGTVVYYRTKSTSASSVTVYSSIGSVSTTGSVVATTGPRYDEYGAGASGNFPTFPSGAGVVVAPTSILSASDIGLALGNWMSAQADGATMVLDSSGGGTAYGAGTEYVIADNVYMNPGYGVLKSNQTIWMYNTRIRSTNRNGVGTHVTASGDNRGSNVLYFRSGGYENLSILGGTLQGANTAAGTYACRSLGPEAGHGISICNYKNLVIRDVTIRQVMGDAVNLNQWNVQQARYGTGWLYPQDFEMGWCLVDGTGRQGVVPNQCYGFWLHHSEIRNPALSCFDFEDNIENPTPYRYIRDGLVEDNIFEKWTWHLVYGGSADPEAGNFHTWALQLTTDDVEVDIIDNWVFRRNKFMYGHAGWGNPVAELEVLGYVANGAAGNGDIHVMACPPFWHDATRTADKTNISFLDNTFELQPDQRNGYALAFREVTGLTITGNDLQGLDVRALDCTSVTFSDNGASTLVTT